MLECGHYRGEITAMREPLPKEKFLYSRRVCVCNCGVCLGWLKKTGEVGYNPVLNEVQKVNVLRFLCGGRSTLKAYHHAYYLTVTKPKREAARRNRQ